MVIYFLVGLAVIGYVYFKAEAHFSPRYLMVFSPDKVSLKIQKSGASREFYPNLVMKVADPGRRLGLFQRGPREVILRPDSSPDLVREILSKEPLAKEVRIDDFDYDHWVSFLVHMSLRIFAEFPDQKHGFGAAGKHSIRFVSIGGRSSACGVQAIRLVFKNSTVDFA